MTRRLISSEEAIPARGQHKRPCSDCPWSRKAINGWLGENSAQEWIGFAHGESLVDCHALTGAQCAGLATYRANVAKSPRDPQQLKLPANRAAVFASPKEFLEHHAKTPTWEKKR